MNFDTLLEIWNHCGQTERRKFIIAHKPFYVRGKEYIQLTKTKRISFTKNVWHAEEIMREHDMIRKAYSTRNLIFKYPLKNFTHLKNPENWRYWGVTSERVAHSFYLEKILGENMIIQCFKKETRLYPGRSLKNIFDAFKLMDSSVFEEVIKVIKENRCHIYDDIDYGSYSTTKKISPSMKKWILSRPVITCEIAPLRYRSVYYHQEKIE